jgi:1,4-dihydroxy-2-naphthoate octaprenyltransferase
MTGKLKSWVMELRAPFLTATLVSIILGTVIAWFRNDVFNPTYFLLALVGGAFAHVGTNVANDYYDHKSRNDEINKEFVRPFSGGSRTIQLGLLKPSEVLVGSLVFFAAATSIGLYLTFVSGPLLPVFVAAGLVSGFFYTAPPFNWVSRGVGEFLVGVNFGALMTLGAYYVQTRALAAEPILVSVPVSLLIAAVLYINEFPDYAADKAVGKKTLVVRLGRDKAVQGYAAIVFGAYVSILLAVLTGVAPSYVLLALIPLPLALESVRHAFRFHSKSLNLVPSNAMTVVLHLITSLLISFGYLMSRFEIASLGYLLALSAVAVCALFTTHSFLQIKRAGTMMSP